MNITEFKGDWEELKRKIRKEFAELTNEDLKFEEVKKSRDAEETAGTPGEITREDIKDPESMEL